MRNIIAPKQPTMPFTHYTTTKKLVTPVSTTYEYVIQFFEKTKEKDEWLGTISSKDYMEKEFTEKQKFSHILSLMEKDPAFGQADTISIYEKTILKKKIVKQYIANYECYKTGQEEEVIYATQEGTAIREHISAENWEEYIEWEEKIPEEEVELEEEWYYCEYEGDYYIRRDDYHTNWADDIKSHNIEDEEDDKIIPTIW